MRHLTLDCRMAGAAGIGTYLENVVPLVIDRLGADYSWTSLGRGCPSFNDANTVDCRAGIYTITEQVELIKKIPPRTDLFWAPHYNIPLAYRGRLVVTIHDVYHLAMAHTLSGWHRRFYARAMFEAVRRKADAVLCISEFTARELIRFTGIDPSKVKVTHLGVGEDWFHVRKEAKPHARPYFLFVGNVKPHKNLDRLVEAFAMLADEIPHDLVIAGKKEGFITGDSAVQQKAARLGERVHFTGYLDDVVLKQYYAHAEALVFPSLYEGFGLPPLEAMACGVPVLVSAVAALPEVCGEGALYCDPYSSRDMAEKMLRLAHEAELREDLRRRGVARAGLFSWDVCAERTADVIEEVLGR